jgi:hypothetical protein
VTAQKSLVGQSCRAGALAASLAEDLSGRRQGQRWSWGAEDCLGIVPVCSASLMSCAPALSSPRQPPELLVVPSLPRAWCWGIHQNGPGDAQRSGDVGIGEVTVDNGMAQVGGQRHGRGLNHGGGLVHTDGWSSFLAWVAWRRKDI